MGEVNRAREAHLGRDVALKTLPQVFATATSGTAPRATCTWYADGADCRTSATVERPPVDERVAADRSLLIAFVRGQEDLDVHDWQLPDPGGRHSEDELTV